MAYTAIPPVSGGGGGGGAPTDATYITQTANGTLSAEQSLAALSSGPMYVTTATGVVTAITTLTGLTSTSTDLTNDVVTGKNQATSTWQGGTLTTQALVIRANAANTTTGSITLSSSTGYVYDVANNYHSWGVAAPVAGAAAPWQFLKNVNARTMLCIASTNNGTATTAGISLTTATTGNPQSGPLLIVEVKSAGFTTSGLQNAGSAYLNHAGGGTGNFVYLSGGDHVFTTNATNSLLRIKATTGSVVLGEGLTTTATDGFLYISSCAGVPTGVPTTLNAGATVPLVWDRTNKKLYVYDGGAWIGGTTPGAFT